MMKSWIRLALLTLATMLCVVRLSADQAAEAPRQKIKAIGYNVLEGFNFGKAEDATAAWLKAEAPDVILFQEIARTDSEGLAEIAKAWGHKYACVLKPYTNYSIGLTSSKPFEFLETRTFDLHHGYILAKINGIYYMSIHLSPFRYKVRRHETEIYAARLKPLLEAGEKVIMMGDFNNPSPYDAEKVNSDEKNLAIRRANDAKYAHHENLNDGFYDFQCIQTLLDIGMEDVCHFHQEKSGHPAPGIRIDMALLSDNLVDFVTAAYMKADDLKRFRTYSDHYPVILELELPAKEVKP